MNIQGHEDFKNALAATPLACLSETSCVLIGQEGGKYFMNVCPRRDWTRRDGDMSWSTKNEEAAQ